MKNIRTVLSLLICIMMSITQFAFALEEADVTAGAGASGSDAAAESQKEEAASSDVKEEKPAKENEEESSKEETKATEKADASSKEKSESAEKSKEADKKNDVSEKKSDSKSAFKDDVNLDGVKVSVSADEGTFPEGVKLSVKKVSAKEQKKVDEAVNKAREDELNVAKSYTFDVKILDKNGKEVQPADNKKASVSFKLDEVRDANLDVSVYHLAEKGKTLKAEELKTETDTDKVSAETEGFSYYTVEFTYDNFQYVLDGDSSVDLTDILKKVGLEGDVSKVEVSNDKLFFAEKKDDKWTITAKKAFTSTEWMKVTIDGIVYEIVVTDAIPGSNVTGMLDMNNGETKTGDFTITGGPVRGAQGGTATIKDGTITNNASNTANGGYSTSNGSALIARGANSLSLQNLTINSTTNNLVLNIWANASINADNVTLKGSTNSGNDTPFLMVGGYPNGGKGTLNFSGNNTISGAKGSVVGGNNNSEINVNSGTLTIKDSDIKVKDGIKINVKRGATLVFDNSSFSQNTPTIILEDGANLIVKNGSTFSTVPNAGAFNIGNGTTVEVDNATFNLGVNLGINIAEGGTLKVVNEAILNMTGNETNGINSSGDIIIDQSTVNGNDKKTVITSKGTLNISGSNLNKVVISHLTDANITESDLNDCMIKVGAGTTLNIEKSKLHDSNRNSEETMIHSNGNGVTVNITESEISDNKNTGSDEGSTVVKVLNGTLNLTDSAFKNNRSNAWGGAIYVNNTKLNVSRSTFEENSITNTERGGGAAIAIIDSPVTIKKSTFTNNDANVRGKGGAVYINNNGKESLSIDDETTFESNKAQIGGAVYINGVPDTTIGNAQFKKNGYSGTQDYGAQDAGALYIESQSGKTEVTLNGTKFEDNKVYGSGSSSGGAIYVRGDKTVLNVNGAKFTNNTSGLYGGAMTVAHKAWAYISDLNGEPTEFKENMVQFATDHAGGGLFINQGYVRMDDVAIYNNYAKSGGGGISSCTKGSAEAKVLGGAAIFDNHVGSDGAEMDDYALVHPDIESYPDIFFETKDHLNRETGEQIREWEIWPIELYERMFNGGLHKWDAKPFNGVKIHDTIPLNSFMAKSNPTNKDISGAKVVFTENVATSTGAWNATGGAIGCNGLLEMGTGTEIKIVKVWDDERNNDGYRPDLDEIFLDNLIVKGNGEEIDIKADPIKTQIVNIKDFDPVALANNIVNMQDSQKPFSDYDAWVIVISGLRLTDDDDKQIKYTVEEKDPDYYSLIENIGGNDTYFEMKNKHNPDLVNISITKEWDDNDNQDGKRESITVRLFADGVEIDKATAGEAEDYKIEFNGLPRFKDGKEIVYTLSEDGIDGYTTEIKEVSSEEHTITTPLKEAPAESPEEGTSADEPIDNDKIEELDQPIDTSSSTSDTIDQIVVDKEFTITNTHIPEVLDIEGKKTWDDDNDKYGIRPESINVSLYADGEFVSATDATEATGWKFKFTDLPVYKDGKEIKYTIEEEPVDGYKATYDGYDITNKCTKTKPTSKTKGAKTGDSNNILALIGLMAVCAAVLAASAVRRRKDC